MAYALDTSGTVHAVPGGPAKQGTHHPVDLDWCDLSPFAQGYVEAMARTNYEAVALSPSDNDGDGQCKHCGRNNAGAEDGPCSDTCPRQNIHFSDLAPETLSRIIADCDAMERHLRRERMTTTGGRAWELRQSGFWPKTWPPLTVQLGDDGKVRFVNPIHFKEA